jgi:hypothetical protein
MSDSPTLHSRLRVLIAKTFRAEKLFSSIRNTSGSQLASLSTLSEIANDARAREWQKSHHELRNALNEMLESSEIPEVAGRVINLREKFFRRHLANTEELQKDVQGLTDSIAREEFAQSLRQVVELIRTKARVQVDKAIADELGSILQASGKGELLENLSRQYAFDDSTDLEGQLDSFENEELASQRGRVLQLKPRAGGIR